MMTMNFYEIDDPAIPNMSVDSFLSECLLFPKGYEYRGQGDTTWDLVPSAFRDERGNTMSSIERTRALNYFHKEEQFEIDFKRLYQLAGPNEQIIVPEKPGYKTLLMLTFFQHFGLPTPMLDWSSSPLIALFMAMFDRPASAVNISIYRYDPSLLPTDATFQPYSKIPFKRIEVQLGGVMFFGHCKETSIVINPHIYSEYIKSPSAQRFIKKINIEISPGDKKKIDNALINNGFREDMLFPNSMRWAVKQIRDNMR